MEYTDGTRGIAIGGLTTGIIGTALSVANGGLNLMNTHANAPEYATKSDLAYAQELARKDSEIALLKSEQNTEIKIADVYERLITRVNADARAQADWNASQSVANAQMSAAIATNAGSIASLQNVCSQITKTVVPNNAICPGWGAVTVTPVTP